MRRGAQQPGPGLFPVRNHDEQPLTDGRSCHTKSPDPAGLPDRVSEVPRTPTRRRPAREATSQAGRTVRRPSSNTRTARVEPPAEAASGVPPPSQKRPNAKNYLDYPASAFQTTDR